MGDLLRQGSQWLEQQRRAHCSSPVTYRRGATELVINATIGRSEYEVEDDYGVRLMVQVADFLILAEEFTPTFTEPQVGDKIVSDSQVYEVMSLSGQGHYRWSDPYHTTLRIHSKEVHST